MKNKAKVITGMLVLCLGLLLPGGCSYKQEASEFNMEEVVKDLTENREIPSGELEQGIDYYVLGGMKEENAIKEAVKQAMVRESVYEEATAEGYNVTDDEIKAYLGELKKTMGKADNKVQVDALIKGFGSEEKYWDYEFSVYKKDLPIIRYQEALEKQYNDKNMKLRLDTVKPTYKEGFGGFLEKYKEALVKDQNFSLAK